jgi:O-antigen ligase
VSLAREFVGSERADSLDFRLKNEYKLLNRAKEQPIFGWGDSGAARLVAGSTREKVVTDSTWIITVGNRGLFGLAAFLAALMMPTLRFLRRRPFSAWDAHSPWAAPAAVLAVALSLYLLDHMVNAMVNPVFALVAGGLAGAMDQPELERPSEELAP